ncbi:MAG: protoheme IX farnesyltransferase, partial [Pseudonocardia sp.]
MSSTTSTTTSHPSTPTRAAVRARRERADAERSEQAAPPGEDQDAGPRKGWRDVLGAYVALTKPRIIELLLVTTLPTMILAQGGLPDLWLVLLTLVGGTLAAASANVFNCYLDRDIDKVMKRTKRRPLATGEIAPRSALVFATALGVVSLLWFALLVNV